MAPLEDHAYMKVCAQLASLLSISLASAKRKVELAAVQEGVKDLAGRKLIAERLLNEARISNTQAEGSTSDQLDHLLEALAGEDDFMVED